MNKYIPYLVVMGLIIVIMVTLFNGFTKAADKALNSLFSTATTTTTYSSVDEW